MSNHDQAKIESLLATGLGAKGMMRIALREYAEHYAAQHQPESTAILEAAKELGRVEVLDAAINSSLLAYPNGQVTWIDPVSIQLKRGSKAEFLDAHREVVV